ncbi:hypothetical protein PYCC9005_004321 [Savitreella phatthalungensis]
MDPAALSHAGSEDDTTDQHVLQIPVVGDKYISHEQVRLMLDNFARHEGFAVSVRASNKINYRWQCVHGGKYRNTRKPPPPPTPAAAGVREDEGTRVDGLVSLSDHEGGMVDGKDECVGTSMLGYTDEIGFRSDGEGIVVEDVVVVGKLRRHHTRRTNCPFLVRAGMDDTNLWKITKVILDHNHPLSPHDPAIYHQNRATPHDPARNPYDTAVSGKARASARRKPSHRVTPDPPPHHTHDEAAGPATDVKDARDRDRDRELASQLLAASGFTLPPGLPVAQLIPHMLELQAAAAAAAGHGSVTTRSIGVQTDPM